MSLTCNYDQDVLHWFSTHSVFIVTVFLFSCNSDIVRKIITKHVQNSYRSTKGPQTRLLTDNTAKLHTHCSTGNKSHHFILMILKPNSYIYNSYIFLAIPFLHPTSLQLTAKKVTKVSSSVIWTIQSFKDNSRQELLIMIIIPQHSLFWPLWETQSFGLQLTDQFVIADPFPHFHHSATKEKRWYKTFQESSYLRNNLHIAPFLKCGRVPEPGQVCCYCQLDSVLICEVPGSVSVIFHNLFALFRLKKIEYIFF